MKQIQQNLAGAFAAAAMVTASTPKVISESDAYHQQVRARSRAAAVLKENMDVQTGLALRPKDLSRRRSNERGSLEPHHERVGSACGTGPTSRLLKDPLNATGRQKEHLAKPTGAARRNEILVKQQARMKNADMMEQYHN